MFYNKKGRRLFFLASSSITSFGFIEWFLFIDNIAKPFNLPYKQKK